MKCPHLETRNTCAKNIKVTICNKNNESFHAPTFLQVQEYCERKNHKKCPLYLRFDGQFKGAPLISKKDTNLTRGAAS